MILKMLKIIQIEDLDMSMDNADDLSLYEEPGQKSCNYRGFDPNIGYVSAKTHCRSRVTPL